MPKHEPLPFSLEALWVPRLCRDLDALLAEGLKEMVIDASEAQRKKLIGYLALLLQWSQRHSFTAIKDPKEMVIKHLLDSASILPYLKGERILDVGTGPGLPGIPLSVLSENKTFFLLDSRQKTYHFLSQTKNLLRLANVHLVCERAQNFQVSSGFSTIVTRAYAKLPQMVQDTQHLLAEEGIMLAMKGKEEESLEGATEGFHIVGRYPLSVPFDVAKRHVVLIQRSADGGSEE